MVTDWLSESLCVVPYPSSHAFQVPPWVDWPWLPHWPITPEDADQTDAAWASDGRHVVYGSNHHGTLSLCIAMVAGAVSGYAGGWIDDALMRLAELFLAMPWLYLLFAVRAFLPLRISTATAFLLIVAVIGVVGWARPARLIRGVVLSAKERKYVLAARGFGASGFYILRRHIVPQTMGVFLTQAAILIPQYILAEVTLSFLGLGVGEPVPSWGNMLGSLQQYHILVSYWWMLAPGLILIPVFWGYHVLADFLHQHLELKS